MVILGLSTYFSITPSKSFDVFSAYVLFYSIFLFMIAYYDYRDIKLITSLLVAIGGVISLLGIYQYLFADMNQLKSWVDVALNPHLSARAYGTFGDPNSFAVFLAPIFLWVSIISYPANTILENFFFLSDIANTHGNIVNLF